MDHRDRFVILVRMKRINLSSIDTRTKLGATLVLASVAALGIGLFAVVSALTDDGVKLPSEGSLDEIVNDSATGRPGYVYNDGSTPPPVPSGPPPVRMTINRLGIDAPVVSTGFVEGTTQPDVPKAAHEIAWYNYGPAPGLNNNAVFSGHVDWQTRTGQPIPGVFYRLRELKIGDPITVELEDGSVIEYLVTGNVATKYDDPNVVRVMERTSKDVITLITCGGAWVNDPAKDNGGNYTHRIIVRAERVSGAAAAAAVP